MQTSQPSRRRARLPLFLALFALLLVAAACAPSTPPPPLSTSTPAVSAPATDAPATNAAPPPAAATLDLPTGVDADGNFYRGDPNAPVTLVEFSDFQCPFCSRHAQQTEPQLEATYVATGQVLHVFRHYPIPQLGHTYAIPAAAAAYCAGQQAPALFWTMHDWLFANQQTWGQAQDAPAQFRQQAIAAGADASKYDACVADPATEARIQRDVAEGGALGVQGTPAFFVNNWFIEGAYPFAEFQDKIAKAAQGLNPPPAPTPLPPGVEFFDLDPARPGFTYDGSPSRGAAEADLVLVTFEDFKSQPAAQHVSDVEPALNTKFIDTNQMRLVFKFFPATAPRAAVAALCASRQDKFWEFRSQLYAEQTAWTEGDDAAMTKFAQDLGLDSTAFTTCLADEAARGEVDTALEFGQKQIGVPTTPSFLLIKLDASGAVADVRGLPGLQTLDALEQAIQMLQLPPAPTPTPVAAITTETLASLPMGIDAEGHFYRGDPQATVKLVDFSDFQCPFCARHVAETEPLLYEAFIATGKVVTIFRNFPLDFHPNATPAAKAAYCAGQQGPKLFWAMHDWLFATQNTWAGAQDAADQFRDQALAIGADAGRYDACINDAQTQAVIQKDLADGAALGVRGTPTFFLSKAADAAATPRPLSGALPYAQFAQALEALLAE